MRAFWAIPLIIGVLATESGAVSPQPEAVIPLSLYVGRLTAMQATVNGRAGTYFFDTGGGVTVISPAAAAAGGCDRF
jgi:beta-lactamase superfamily II metal-dependent hydrolase